ncbi:MAG TPA: caspase family protein [Anaeromyxobacteraceae bacterium]|nr:caspase family protein [Anaeromyxobacteraceae bacterium]
MSRRAAIAALLLAAVAPATARGAARFAILVGNDAGAPGRPRLYFAEKDAERVRAALLELGDFSEDRVLLLKGRSAAALREAFAATEARIQATRRAGERTLLVVYFSGHAGPVGLELGGDTFSYEELRKLTAASLADTRIVVLDACESGGLTQVKSARPLTAIDFALPADETAQGTAFITSAAVGEAAQESASLGGSFFTHHLDAGLRGAADADGDGQVTLAEAFRYTSARTVAGTASTQAGVQHPTYEFKMSGRGDVVLADLRRAEARLVLPADPGSTWVLRGPKGLLVEVPAQTTAVAIALPAGRYGVERRSPDGRAAGDVVLEKGATRELPLLSPTRYEVARTKGGPKPNLAFVEGGVAWFDLSGLGVLPTVRAGVRKEFGPVGLRITFDWAGGRNASGTLSYTFQYFGGSAALLWPLTESALFLEVGPQVTLGYATQSFPTSSGFSSGILGLGAAAMATVPVGPLRLGLDLAASAQVFKLNGGTVLRPGGTAGLLLLFGF